MTAFAVSAIGFPPFAGFWASLCVRAIIDAGFGWVAVVGLVSSVVAAFYYLRLIKAMWFDRPRVRRQAPCDPRPWLIPRRCSIWVALSGSTRWPRPPRPPSACPGGGCSLSAWTNRLHQRRSPPLRRRATLARWSPQAPDGGRGGGAAPGRQGRGPAPPCCHHRRPPRPPKSFARLAGGPAGSAVPPPGKPKWPNDMMIGGLRGIP